MARHTTIFYNGLVNSKKISYRIKSIISLVPKGTEVVWDLCCDHGQIGQVFLPENKVIFIDQVAPIVERLRNKIAASDIPRLCYDIILKDATQFDYPISSKNNCYIIVGIGADLLIKILQKIPRNKQDTFIICAHQYSYKLREFLVNTPSLKLQKEILINEAGQFYEVLRMGYAKGESTPLVGRDMWFNEAKDQSLYRQ